MRLTVSAAVACLIVGVCSADDAGASINRRNTNIPPENLGVALQELARSYDVQLVYFSAKVDTLQTHGAVGELSADEAFERVLRGTGLAYRYLSDRTVTIVPVGEDGESKEHGGTTPSSPPNRNQTPAASGDTGVSDSLAEVIVTAQKREERLQDTPVPVSVLDGRQLADNGLTNLRDYAIQVPSLSVTPYYAGAQSLSIRGIATGGFDSGTVALTINGVFFPISIVPDIDPGDLQRIEVLKGPQGTIFGTSSMGGVINYVTEKPDPSHFFGRVQSGVSAVSNGSATGFEERAAFNIPLSGDLAVRASGFETQTPGFIDNPVYNLRDVNQARSHGAGLDTIWQPSTGLSVRLSAIYQKTTQAGLTETDRLPGLGALEQNYIPGTGDSSRIIQAYSATIDYKIGKLELTSVTGYNTESAVETLDDTPNVGDVTALVANGARGTPFRNNSEARHIVEELRATLPVTDRLTALFGGYFRRSSDREEFQFFATDPPSTNVLLQTWENYNLPVITREYALFGNLTYQVTPQLDVQVGLRETHLLVTQAGQYSTGPFNPYFISPDTTTTSVFAPGTRSSSNTLTYLFTPEYKISPDVMVYARFASGFRPGGANNTGVPGIPAQFAPDQTHDYEIGLKGGFFDNKLNLDTSAYYIAWDGIQFSQNYGGFFYTGNAGAAKSEGVEVSAQWSPFDGMRISGWIDYDNALLTRTVDSSDYLVAGERLPDVSTWSGRIALDESLPISRDLTAFVGVAANWVGNRVGLFQPVLEGGAAPPRQNYPAYVRTDLRAGINSKMWTASVYVNNLADHRAIIGGGLGNIFPYAFVPLQPRTIGASLTARF